jgi:hypothetical protein
VIGRMIDDRLFLDCRTVLPTQVTTLAAALTQAAETLAPPEAAPASKAP